jgi:hypothetical protein
VRVCCGASVSTEKQNDSGSAPADPELSLEATIEQKQRIISSVSGGSKRRGVDGYNPYDAVPTPKPGDAKRKPTDLRKLSEWIRAQRQVESLKQVEPPKKDDEENP